MRGSLRNQNRVRGHVRDRNEAEEQGTRIVLMRPMGGMKSMRKSAGAEALPVYDPRFTAYVMRLVELIESGQAIDSDKRAAEAALKRIEDALAGDNVNYRFVDAVRKTARILHLTLD